MEFIVCSVGVFGRCGSSYLLLYLVQVHRLADDEQGLRSDDADEFCDFFLHNRRLFFNKTGDAATAIVEAESSQHAAGGRGGWLSDVELYDNCQESA